MTSYNTKNVLTTAEAFFEIAKRHLDRISPEQWGKLTNGSCDMHSKTILHTMLIQMLQMLSSNVSNLVIPMKEVADKSIAEEDDQNTFQAIRTVLSESIADVFAKALKSQALPLNLDFNSFQQDLEELFEEIHLMLEYDSNQQFQDILSSETVVRFSKKLTNRLYLQMTESYLTPQDSVLAVKQEPPSVQSHSPQLLYAMVEDEVDRYIQMVVFFMLLPTKEDILRDDILETSTRQQNSLDSTEPFPTTSAQFDSERFDLFYLSMSHPKASTSADISLQTPEVWPCADVGVQTPEVWQCADVGVQTPQVQPVQATAGSATLSSDLSQSQVMAQYMITALLIKIYRRRPTSSCRDRKYREIIQRLTHKAWDQLLIPESQTSIIKKNLRQIIHAVLEDLRKEFGSPARVLASALDPKDTRFDAAVLKSLKSHLFEKKKPAVVRFFSCICRTISKPFRTCCCSIDTISTQDLQL